jgi:hypothetical protein
LNLPEDSRYAIHVLPGFVRGPNPMHDERGFGGSVPYDASYDQGGDIFWVIDNDRQSF